MYEDSETAVRCEVGVKCGDGIYIRELTFLLKMVMDRLTDEGVSFEGCREQVEESLGGGML